MNKLQEEIAKLEAKEERNELDERLLQMLLEKQRELGDDITEDEAQSAAGSVLLMHLLGALREAAPDAEVSLEQDAWEEDMEDEKNTIHRYFREKNWKYRDHIHQKGVHVFELGLRENGKLLHMKVYLESAAKVCRIDAVYPFVAEREFAYPLCEKLITENYPRRYGALQYDTKDGELSYRYSFPIRHGLHDDDFRTVFMAVVASATVSYDLVKQYAIGRFHKQDRAAITCQAQKLIIELER